MGVKEKIAALRGGGHHIPHGLEEILQDLDKRLAALEPKPRPGKKDPGDELNK